MKYVITSTRSIGGFGQRLEITYDSGAPLFDAKSSVGKSGNSLTVSDHSGREVASIRTRLGANMLVSGWHEVFVGEEHVARVQSLGKYSAGYRIEADSGVISAQGNFGNGECTVSIDGTEVATTKRLGRWRVSGFDVDIDDGEDQMLLLSIILAMANIFLVDG